MGSPRGLSMIQRERNATAKAAAVRMMARSVVTWESC